MESLLKYINFASRCATLYRDSRTSQYDDLKGCQHAYIFQICKNPGISQDELSQNIFVNKSSVTRQLASLEKSGYVTRKTSCKDKRVINVFPTDKATKILPKVRLISRTWNESVLENLSESQKELLLLTMKQVVENAENLIKDDKVK